MSRLNRLVAMGALAALGSTSPAFAEDFVIEEIVVTAQKREQNQQDIPIAVTALGSEQLQLGGIQDASRLELLTPGLSFGQSGADARPAIRGARTESINERQDPVIGFFVDGVYQSRTSLALASLVDVERVEVLRGPQGTLFGRNTFGGAISVVSKAPTEDLDFGIDLLAGEYDRVRADAFLNVPVADNFQLRFALREEERDGYIENDGTGDDLNDQDQTYFRASAAWQPTDTIEAIARYSRWDQGGNGGGDFGYTVLGTLREAADPINGDTDLNGVLDRRNPRGRSGGNPADRGPYDVFRDTQYDRDIQVDSFSLDVAFDLEFATIRSITGYTDASIFRQADADFSGSATGQQGSLSNVETESETFSQEIQLISGSTDPFSWVAGAYYLTDETSEIFLFDVLCDSTAAPPGAPATATQCTGPAAPGVIEFGARGEVDTTSLAFYAQGTYAINDRLRATVGARWTEDEKDFERFDQDQLINNGANVQLLDESDTFTEVTYRLGIDYDLNDDMLLYGVYSTGFNSGGFNTSGPSLSFDEQTVDAYEIGLKSTLADGTVTLNLSAYRNEYDDLLAQGFASVGPTVVVFSDNAGETEVTGLEVELDAYATENLRIRASANFVDSEVGDFVVGNPFNLGGETINGVGNLLQLDGSDVALTPDVTLSLAISYRINLGDMGTITPYVQSYYSSSFFTNDVNFDAGEQESYTKTDFRVIWESAASNWRGELFIENIEDEAVLNRTVVGGQDAIFANFGDPQIWGLRVGYQHR